MKYAEVTTIVEPTTYRAFTKFIVDEDWEPMLNGENDKIIVNFEDDNSVYDTKDYHNKKYIKGRYEDNYNDINIIDNETNKIYKRKTSRMNLDKYPYKLFMDFTPIFSGCPKYNSKKLAPSKYNMIYMYETKDVFALVKQANSERYLVAYDDKIFEKTDVIYLIKFIFTNLLMA